MIEISYSYPTEEITSLGNFTTPVLQSSWRFASGAAGDRLVLTLRLRANELGSVIDECRAGITDIPNYALPISASGKIICESTDVQFEAGGMATVTLTYRERNERETDADCAKGLLSRTISTRWVERQEMLEHFMARKSDEFDAAAFAAWMEEPNPVRKAAHSYADETGEVVALEGDTLAAAERFDMGVQYASLYMLQIEVNELWSTPVDTSAQCNRIINAIPEEHKPLFGIDGLEDYLHYIRCADSVQHRGANLYARTVTYLGLPNSFVPTTPPTGWGSGAFDELLYGDNSGGSGGS